MKKTDSELLINIDTGVITFRNDTNDSHCNCVPISRKHAELVENGELPVATVVAAIKSHLREKRDFDFDAYVEERRKLNVRKSAMRVEERKPELSDRSGEMVSDAEIDAAKKSGEEQDGGGLVEQALKAAAVQDNFIPAEGRKDSSAKKGA